MRRGLKIVCWVNGVLLGLLLGYGTLGAVFILGMGTFWLFIFGDNPWPEWAMTLLMGMACGAGGLAFIAVLGGTWQATRSLQVLSPEKARTALIGGVLLMVLLGVLLGGVLVGIARQGSLASVRGHSLT